ncbi:succinylglutamate desuccinylase/aspartoacylase family protein [Mesorhizobium sp. M1169]|uniref:succinylglutamate desuccinylase/aspartoacylase domain-containing protein n=1 Tax=Mesorhizobium sp. M1169 TaxID=2957066 RepID=UPI003339BA87
MTGGNHGNELEGPLVARRLIEWLPEAQTCGRVIVLPVRNPLAVQAWSRNTSADMRCPTKSSSSRFEDKDRVRRGYPIAKL